VARSPDGTQELVLICEDPDAPGGTFTHWVVIAIPPAATAIDEGTLPDGAVTGHRPQRLDRSTLDTATLVGVYGR
jgi:phosphatidylethanolamine-binding protein (PEBP) family uncharacterized protein